ncbi:S41 family peptidase [Bacteroides sp. CR5/BHMF/2]|nr:S41 family peptidase [Bacteroides sp. CR5/BHMF/2]
MIQQFKAEGITDLILDLRFNNGGSVELARYLAASIAGTSHRSDVFMKMQRNSGADEYIRFGDGDDLNLNSVRIICSEETASASELIINGLRGIDFPVKLFGSRTEGKNVEWKCKSINMEINIMNLLRLLSVLSMQKIGEIMLVAWIRMSC